MGEEDHPEVTCLFGREVTAGEVIKLAQQM